MSNNNNNNVTNLSSQEAEEAERLKNNEKAWGTCTGYKTTSGYPCYDKTMNACIPKSHGYGMNPNFWVCCCGFLCDP